MRQAFETWVKSHPYFGYAAGNQSLLERDGEGYLFPGVHAAWLGFVARSETDIDAKVSERPANYDFPDALSGNEWLKLRDWFANPDRKRANLAFTAGAARDAATAFESAGISIKTSCEQQGNTHGR